MGYLNDDVPFEHWFGNIHLSGPCNRSCYFCIGQHMMGLDALNVLDEPNLPGFDDFVSECLSRRVNDINLTGSNTDPLMYKHVHTLRDKLWASIPNLRFGIRTNGALILSRRSIWECFTKASISVPSLNPAVYVKMMGSGTPPDLAKIMQMSGHLLEPLKINIVIGPENTGENFGEIRHLLDVLADLGIRKVNVREPYGQPNIGDPMAKQADMEYKGQFVGMPWYAYKGIRITYWHCAYVEVRSVNLYASGRVTTTYSVTKGHDAELGQVRRQAEFTKSGRQFEQWQGKPREHYLQQQLAEAR